jgi:hypothetical protein
MKLTSINFISIQLWKLIRSKNVCSDWKHCCPLLSPVVQLMSHCCPSVVPLMSRCCPSVVPLISRCCPSVVPLLSRCCPPVVPPMPPVFPLLFPVAPFQNKKLLPTKLLFSVEWHGRIVFGEPERILQEATVTYLNVFSSRISLEGLRINAETSVRIVRDPFKFRTCLLRWEVSLLDTT